MFNRASKEEEKTTCEIFYMLQAYNSDIMLSEVLSFGHIFSSFFKANNDQKKIEKLGEFLKDSRNFISPISVCGYANKLACYLEIENFKLNENGMEIRKSTMKSLKIKYGRTIMSKDVFEYFNKKLWPTMIYLVTTFRDLSFDIKIPKKEYERFYDKYPGNTVKRAKFRRDLFSWLGYNGFLLGNLSELKIQDNSVVLSINLPLIRLEHCN